MILISFLTLNLKTGAIKTDLLVFGLILIFVSIYIGLYRPGFSSEKIKGAKIIRAKLYENYFLGYNTPFGAPNVKIDLRNKPTVLLIKLKYLVVGRKFISTTDPWAGWAILFLLKEPVWGPNISLLRLNIYEHRFIYETIKQSEKLGSKISYLALDPQYLDLFLLKLRDLLKRYSPENALSKIGVKDDGTLEEELKAFVPPKDLQDMANIPPTYEDVYETFISK
ncbi:MAG: hypothetical protein ACP5NL_00725 [Thermoplasmata archaeon]